MTRTLELPEDVYEHLQSLAAEQKVRPAEMIRAFLDQAEQKRAWLRNFKLLMEKVKQDGGLMVNRSEEEVVEIMRKTRREIFEAEYAHLY